MTGPLWSELGTTMRRARDEAGISLRDLETRGDWRRSTISQVETGKARPSRRLVEWYDTELGTDGLLLSIYAEARSQQLFAPDDQASSGDGEPDTDAVTVVDQDPPTGLLVGPSEQLQARITLTNSGARPWRGRMLRRMGAYAGARLIGSAPQVPVPDTEPGALAQVVITIRTPERLGSVIAYWRLVTADGEPSAPNSVPVAVLLVVS